MNSLTYNNVVIKERDDMLSLTDMWRAANGSDSQRPYNWLALKSASQVVSHMASLVGKPVSELVQAVNENGTWNTWAHWQIGMAYAMYVGKAPFVAHLLGRLADAKDILRALRDFEVPDDLPDDLFVYAIRECDTGHLKLGISRDPSARVAQLQTGNSSRLELVTMRPARNRFADERAVRADAQAWHLRGEWFSAAAIGVLQ